MGRPAALMLTEDGQVLITFDARMEEDEMNAAFLKVMEAARTLL
jgi:hypothetical protein